MNRYAIPLLSLALLIPSASLAGGGSMPSTVSVYQQIQRELPDTRFERESRIRLGRIALTFIKPLVRIAMDEDDEARAILRSIKRVDIATYRIVDMQEGLDSAGLRGIESRMADRGWSKIVRTRDEGDNTWVFSRHRDSGGISGIFVVELDEHELSLVGVEGRIDELLANTIADDPGDFAGLFGS